MTGGGRVLPVIDADRLPESAPLFQRIAVIGLGSVGLSLAMALRQAWPPSLVIGVDAPEALEAAVRLNAVDVGAADLMIAAEADLIVLAGSSVENVRVLAHLEGAIARQAVILAIGGDSRTLAGSSRSLPGRMPLAAALPSVVSPGEDLAAARPTLFLGRPWYLTQVTAPEDTVERLQGLIRAIGGQPVIVPAAQYDELIASAA